jgi:hypothetical protein
LVNNHQRTTERDTPQSTRIAFTERPGFLEVALSELRLNLWIRGRCGAKQDEQE